MTGASPAGWFPDPFARYEFRYWDGGEWTHHVATRGVPAVDPPVAAFPALGGARPPAGDRTAKKVRRQVESAGVVAGWQRGGGTLFTEPVLVVNQKPKLVEVNAEYAVYEQYGRQIATVREVGQSLIKNAIGIRVAPNRTRQLQIVDPSGRVVLALNRPANFIKSTVIVSAVGGVPIGRIAQKSIGIGKIRFALESASGEALGSISGEGWLAWDFSIQDASGAEIGRINRSWAGLSAPSRGRDKRDQYVVHLHASSDEPLRSLVIASALAIDTALRSG